ncbi:MAG: hypothetical protein JW808_06610 [Victivallales bacterium]|nr:hypothetical protein [Victivallales bacterium]
MDQKAAELRSDEREVSSAVDFASAGMRLDIWLAARFTYRSRSQWQQMIQEGKILLDGSTCAVSAKLKPGQKVNFISSGAEPEVNPDYKILYDDGMILGIDKPAPLPCHPSGAYFKNTLWHMLGGCGGNVHFVSRLDRETSGVILTAKEGPAAAACSRAITLKRYNVVVHGDFPDSLEAEGFLFEDPKRADSGLVRKKRFFSYSRPDAMAETASTTFRCIRRNHGFSLLEADLHTGRTHQIRATLCSLGFPVAGDKIYGPDESIFIRFASDSMTPQDLKTLRISRQALHCHRTDFIHLTSKKFTSITADTPHEILELLGTGEREGEKRRDGETVKIARIRYCRKYR